MGFKQSLGFTPLDDTSSDESDFSYVGNQKTRTGRTDSIFDDYEAKDSFSLVDSFSEKMKAQRAEAIEAEDRAEKKIASYYLEVDTLNKIKEWAEATKASYSSIVEKALQAHLVN
ncbi:hypothetical protein BH23BAC3_BH23BAC3_03700 [soil metagenome]